MIVVAVAGMLPAAEDDGVLIAGLELPAAVVAPMPVRALPLPSPVQQPRPCRGWRCWYFGDPRCAACSRAGFRALPAADAGLALFVSMAGRSLWRNRDFMLLQTGQLLSTFGSGL